jgi:hypothetical protein
MAARCRRPRTLNKHHDARPVDIMDEELLTAEAFKNSLHLSWWNVAGGSLETLTDA